MQETMTRRTLLRAMGWACLASAGGSGRAFGQRPGARTAGPAGPTAADTFALLKHGKKIPVIFDTDIGNDIDDTWALTMLLKSPELDLRLVAADSSNCVYRARIIAKMLQVAGRTDVPVAVGMHRADKPGPQSRWVGDYTLDRYPGKVYQDGVGAIIETIAASPDPVTLVCVGPVPNIRAALERDPSIARRARFVGMHGSVRRGYGGRPKPDAEYNVRADPKALQAVFAAPWDLTITPLDTCGIVRLAGDRYARVYRCQDRTTRALMDNYRVWARHMDRSGRRIDPSSASTTLFDTVAVYLAYSQSGIKMETLRLRVTDGGMTVMDPAGRPVHCAMAWQDLGGYQDHLVSRLTRA